MADPIYGYASHRPDVIRPWRRRYYARAIHESIIWPIRTDSAVIRGAIEIDIEACIVANVDLVQGHALR
jgi:hypothetical protein